MYCEWSGGEGFTQLGWTQILTKGWAMRKRIALLAALSLVAGALATGVAAAAPADKVDICHVDEYQASFLINVSGNALAAHLAHGDALPGEPVPGVSGKKFAEDCSLVDAGPVVTEGQPSRTRAAGVRIKGWNSGSEIYLGSMTSSSATPRVEAQYNDFSTVGQKTYSVSFSFDQATNAISASISSPSASLLFDFDTAGNTPGCATADWDTLEIFIRDSRTDSGVALENVILAGFPLGDFGAVDKAGMPGALYWTVTDFDFSQSFQVTADMVVDGFLGNESMKIEFNVGCLTP